MTLCTIIKGNHFLADFVAAEARNTVNPKPKIGRTADEALRILAPELPKLPLYVEL